MELCPLPQGHGRDHLFVLLFQLWHIWRRRGHMLAQHLPDTLGDDRHRGGTIETLSVQDSSTLGSVVGSQVQGKSYHHQAVDTLGAGLRVTAKAEDGTVEALEATKKYSKNIAVSGTQNRSSHDIVAAIEYIKSGKLKALAITSKERVPAMPEVPTLQESGVAGAASGSWLGLLALWAVFSR